MKEQAPTLVLHNHKISKTAITCDECNKPLDWHKSFGKWCACAFKKGKWQDYMAESLQDQIQKPGSNTENSQIKSRSKDGLQQELRRSQ